MSNIMLNAFFHLDDESSQKSRSTGGVADETQGGMSVGNVLDLIAAEHLMWLFCFAARPYCCCYEIKFTLFRKKWQHSCCYVDHYRSFPRVLCLWLIDMKLQLIINSCDTRALTEPIKL